MGMSGAYGPADDRESIATIQAAVDAGVTFLDTGDFYGTGHNELLLREALKGPARQSVHRGQVRRPARAGRRAASAMTRAPAGARARSPTA